MTEPDPPERTSSEPTPEPAPSEPVPFEPLEPFEFGDVRGTELPLDGVMIDDTPVVRPVLQPPAEPAQPPVAPPSGKTDESDGEN